MHREREELLSLFDIENHFNFPSVQGFALRLIDFELEYQDLVSLEASDSQKWIEARKKQIELDYTRHKSNVQSVIIGNAYREMQRNENTQLVFEALEEGMKVLELFNSILENYDKDPTYKPSWYDVLLIKTKN
ncbi:hypothetical protein C1N66_12610 [Bacillus cereus]|uniref:Uncharacterized protein n=1 Tax=Bacillus cereus TaxID=1396 RepID=A0AB73UHC4_BACCE|nr:MULTISPECIES: hypothetical protein [Bacillus]KIQ88319.1 hypothetical protein RW25_14375 [Bacillus sp. L_1B0_8]KIQ92352.1 hypothetical protein RT27_00980 [Bacillus sp. L_1B0_5]QHV07138.1 hypothetical protein C1N82_29495 [Bacillus cereus]QHV43918.1 hypothetical protein C1N66_12610 [Bacillus cereus]